MWERPGASRMSTIPKLVKDAPIITTSGPPVKTTTKVSPWYIDMPPMLVSGDDVFTTYAQTIGDHPEDYNSAAGLIGWTCEGGLQLVRPLLVGSDNTQASMHIFLCKQIIPRDRNPRAASGVQSVGDYALVWERELIYSAMVQASTHSHATYGTTALRRCDTVVAELSRMPDPGVRWIKPTTPDNVGITCMFDAVGAQMVQIFVNTGSVNGTAISSAATSFTIMHSETNGG